MSPPQPPPSRSWLFVPGAIERFVAKLPATAPDAVVLDLEDGVAPADLPAARQRVGRLLGGGSETWLPAVVAVRSHAASHAAFADDLACLGERASVLLLPKVSGHAEVAHAAESLDQLGLSHVSIVVTVESAAGLRHLERALAHPRVLGVAFGSEDFAADVGLPPRHTPTTDDLDGRAAVLDAARAQIVVAAAAAGTRWRIDSPELRLESVGDLAAEVELAARRSRSFGFTGKLAVHPTHVPPLHAGFRPSESEVRWARSVLAAAGQGAVAAAGQLVDEAVARQARQILSLVDAG